MDSSVPAHTDPHICDVLIAERAPRLTRSWPWPLVRPALYKLLNYKAARRMAEGVKGLSGQAAFDYMSDLLNLKVSTLNLERIPATGRCVIVCNHPTGIADGVAVYDAIKQRRSDAIFFANADALRVSPRLGEIVIPVEWVVEKRTREKTRATLDAARQAFEGERCVVMFPAGRLARVGKDGSVTDPEWAPTAASMARKYNAPVIPIHVAGPTSTLFHLFDKVSQELRDITLFHELLNKRKKAFQLKVGLPIPPTRLDIDATKATYALKAFTERVLPSQPDAEFA
ncbi:GNAT family N-acetyltransferase [Brevundimonas goettingensis]|uniref:1-acyl-sn-glycerol-3-phosphate acyltransferase n=1 Tax=Brevundimonas goettingensis TaxID=2774190 RepID=A0A975GW13_9CAUL|nr:1-acyl-sn-glycerol-3-phosphate acyltransferase [Brevundimonas goettingensis]QTC91283.1 1-acyl-sn-glycerol-3-phosphate acyltransferase [Brevundimonas goettingensis]